MNIGAPLRRRPLADRRKALGQQMRRRSTLAAFALALGIVGAAQPRSVGAVTVQARIVPGTIAESTGKITMIPSHVKAGSIVTFVVTNTDRNNHHVFEINGRLTKSIPAGAHGILRNVRFTRPGTYVASSPGTAEGIGGILTVTS
jgi:hypothetical protein